MCFEGIRSASAPPLKVIVPGSIVQESINNQRAFYIPNLKFYPGSVPTLFYSLHLYGRF